MHKQHGFTIIELIVVVVVIALLATLGGLAWRTARDNSLDDVQKNNVTILMNAIEKYYSDNGEFPVPTVACATNTTHYKICQTDVLTALLVPKYIDAVPRDKEGNVFYYAVERKSTGREDRYGLRVKQLDGTYCRAGEHTNSTWWSGVNECNF